VGTKGQSHTQGEKRLVAKERDCGNCVLRSRRAGRGGNRSGNIGSPNGKKKYGLLFEAKLSTEEGLVLRERAFEREREADLGWGSERGGAKITRKLS